MDQKKGAVERTSEKAGTINPVWNEERILYAVVPFLFFHSSVALARLCLRSSLFSCIK